MYSTEALGSKWYSLGALERKQSSRPRWSIYQGEIRTTQGLTLDRKDMNYLGLVISDIG